MPRGRPGLEDRTSSSDFFFRVGGATLPPASLSSLGTFRAWVKKSLADRVEIFSIKYVLPRGRSSLLIENNNVEGLGDEPRGAINIPPVATTLLTSWTLKLTAPSIT